MSTGQLTNYNMTYTVTNITQETAKTGKLYQRADLTDSNGQFYEKVSAFNGEFQREGMAIDGYLESKDFNGKLYYTFKSKPSVGGKSAQIERVIEKKNESIANFQDAKEKSIQLAGAITNATNLTVAEANAGLIKSDYRTRLRENIVFYQNLYKYPENINPATGNKPTDYDVIDATTDAELQPF